MTHRRGDCPLRAAQFDSRFGNRTGVRKPDAKLLRFSARSPVFSNRSPSSGIFQRVEHLKRLKTSSSNFLVPQRERRSKSDPEKEMGLYRRFPTPENGHSWQRPETL
jgi:hypothetical protein